MTKPTAAPQVARQNDRPRGALLQRSDDEGVAGVNPRAGSWRHYRCCLAFTIALIAGLPGGSPVAQSDSDRLGRPAPNIERQIDRLERGGSVDPLTRRRLEDQLRRAPRGPERSAAERTLDRLPPASPLPDHAPLPAPPEPDSLPSSLRPGFGGSGGGSGGGPGTSGHMVPPGGRSGNVR